MGFSDDLRRMGASMWETEHNHPFVTGIGDGTLPLDKFRYYMRQDYLFLVGYCRAISLAVAKASTVEDMGWFAKLIHETLNLEMSLHISFCEDFGISKEELLATKPSPTTVAYTNQMIQTGFSGSVGEIACVILPCAWGYCEIGQMLADRGKPDSQPLYGRWIDMYNSEEYEELVLWLRSFVDRVGADASDEELQRMKRAFMLGSQYEYMFWDAAYRLEAWPV
ncbi:MAG: thiaminase II [SAR202 cluster bacterium]|jgi:thiaminase/transcriptional activator TenA|nr:thiaminase II [SAR202 cluster bacterium]MDP6513233.1 thiaminase II [SAR202 cluster bacterium]MDP6714157.1 thiaminase II [SAR202 cluster bacterium]